MKKNELLVVIPAYNEEATIHHVFSECPNGFDLVVVNDGSTDQTEQILAELGIPYLNHPINLGYAVSLQTGFRYALEAGYPFVATMDADGQHRFSDIKPLLQYLVQESADLVLGSRFLSAAHFSREHRNIPLGRRLGMSLFSWISSLLSHQYLSDTSSGFRVMRQVVCREMICENFVDLHSEILIYLILRGYKIREASIAYHPRVGGESMHNTYSHFRYPLTTVVVTLLNILSALRKGRIRTC